ncbi:hypothetical protein [Stygiolobus caldivivus]|uniref:Uncharacterized protein n=1 Tax=Stygiolobus caldivivus TaxID=2824673 RepID=A0A8D5U5Z9_9CREN|nr:hypothetical protein [Stygiolobus caldivivus]BCU69948.1 hypothetical protein KN1_12450 [Stygiolobus caldivivus]
MGSPGGDGEFEKLIKAVMKSIYNKGSLCVTFSDIKKETNLHQQVLTNILKKGKSLGIIAECSELGLGENGYIVLPVYVIILEQSVVSEVVEVNDKYVIMRHEVKSKLYNNSKLLCKGVIIKVFGDVCLDKPLSFEGKEHRQVFLQESTDKYYVFHFDSDFEIKPGDTYVYRYEFYLKYFPPKDYFIVEPFNHVISFNAKTYLTNGGKRVIKSVNVEYPPDIVVIRENSGKTYHEVEAVKLRAFNSIKFWFHI